jgi:hypothetical protein
MIELLGILFGLIVIALPWLVWAKILAMSFDGQVGITVTLGSLLIGVPMYYAIVMKVLEAAGHG